ncbi:MAG: Gfo/Idh/MocA family oxidoreductase [Candidatus Thorarchaeota archaeon]|nr:Gfo/Idh/MocA family oxidoreductase [Candidatus Thorarchaeota archaeon]
MTSLKIGIVGTGNMGRIHARILSDMGVLAGVADTNMDTATDVAKSYGIPAFSSYEELIEDTTPDALIISTPTSSHAAIAKEILSKYDCVRGLLIEKPLASTLEDAKKVAEIVNKKGVVTQVSHSEIYNPIVTKALLLIKTDAIGVPRTVIHDRRGFVQPSRIPSLGDVYEDIGVHDFDIMARISHGKATLYAQSKEEGGIYNSGTVLVNFESGTQHVFHLSREYTGRRRYMDVSGTKGSLTLDLFAQIIKIQNLDQEPMAASDTIKLPERGATIKVYGEPVREVLIDFISCVKSGKTPRVSIDDALCALEIVESTRESTRTGKVVNIDVKLKR